MSPTSGLRVALYSHDTCGLGHLRRNLLVGSTLLESGVAENVLLLSGAREITAYESPAGLDIVTLPSIRKSKEGSYAASRLRMGIDELSMLRSQILSASVRAFSPDVLIVDNVPRGASGELMATLRERRWQSDTRIVLGLRDVLDSPERIAREWAAQQNFAAIRELYDEVWIYGDPNVFAAHEAYSFPCDVVERIHYTGYFDRVGDKRNLSTTSAAPISASAAYERSKPVVCLVGGGQDGFKLATEFLTAVRRTRDRAVVLAGPYMPLDLVCALESQAVGANVEIRRFDTDPIELYRSARRIVTMGGYNTICELLGLHIPTLVVPRTIPRKEQLIRAEVMAELGVIDFLHPEDATSSAISDWLERADVAQKDARDLIQFDAVTSLQKRLLNLSTQLRVA